MTLQYACMLQYLAYCSLYPVSSQPSGDRPTVFIEIIQRVGCMPGDVVSSTAVAKAVRDGGEHEATALQVYALLLRRKEVSCAHLWRNGQTV